jgi:phosphohistidine phosphatase
MDRPKAFTLDIVLVRHGTAEASAHRDRERALTLEGRRESRALGERLSVEGFAPELVIASPFVRALQTAELVAAALGQVGPMRVSRALRPDSAAEGVVKLLAALADDGIERVMLVAHEPILSSTCAALTGHGAAGIQRAEAVRLAWQPPLPGNARVRWRGTGA